MNWLRLLLVAVAVFCSSVQGLGQELIVDAKNSRLYQQDRDGVIPELLKPWIPWVLKQHQKEFCPFRFSDPAAKSCTWPSRLSLDATDSGGRFTLDWAVYAEDFVVLPGDEKTWPFGVTVNNRSVAVVQKDGRPQLWLTPGFHRLTGTFAWKTMPENIWIPEQSGLLQLTVNGKLIKFVDINEQGRLWLQQEKQQEQKNTDGEGEGEVFEINVQRRIVDEIPFLIETRLDIYVAGKNREIVLDGVLLPGFTAASLSSALPVKLEKDNKLRLKLSPGKWDIRVSGRHHEIGLSELKIPTHSSLWPDEEVWVFEARPQLRLTQIEGVTSIDPKQTQLPPEWQQFPTYRITSAETLKLVEQQRGHVEPRPPSINLARDIWIDFSGQGYTLKDQLSGQLNAVTRLVVSPPISLGRAILNDKDQLITQLDPNAGLGVEGRPGPLHLTGDSRINASSRVLPAVGWNLDIDDVSVQLHLPPGYRLFTVFGADHVDNTWLEFWNLVHIFLVALIIFASAALFDKKLAVVFAVTLILCYPEYNFPKYTWFFLLVSYAALRYIPQPSIKRISAATLAIVLFTIGIDSVFFAVEQVQKALYPVLERTGAISDENGNEQQDSAVTSTAMTSDEFVSEADMGSSAEMQIQAPGLPRQPAAKQLEPSRLYYDLSGAKRHSKTLQVDPKANVQTGPGLPSWNWTKASIRWQGAVKRDHTFTLALMPPWLNFLLGFLRVGFMGALLVFLFKFSSQLIRSHSDSWDFNLNLKSTIPAFLAVVAGLSAATPSAKALESQSKLIEQSQLEELKQWLLKPSACGKSCAAYDRLEIEASEYELTLSFGVHAYALTAIPLPGAANQWFVSSLTVNGQNNQALHRDSQGILWLVVKPGIHSVRVRGSLPNRDTAQISLPMRPFLVTFRSDSWNLEGASGERVEETLVLRRKSSNERKASSEEQDVTQLPHSPFLQIERRLNLGLTWTVTTTVTRRSNENTSIQARIPLLKGEAVTTAGLRVEQGHAVLNLAPSSNEIFWESVLEQQPSMELTAPQTTEWVEHWIVDSSPIWHVESTGLPNIEDPSLDDRSLRIWRPWPGEKLTLTIARPTPIEGQTKTIDQVSLETKPGLRLLNASLTLRIRASLGGQHVIKLDDKAEVTSLKIDNQETPIRQDKGSVTFPIRPGSQNVVISWRENRGLNSLFHTPTVDLKSPAVNVTIKTTMTEKRWILLTGGPRVGPIVLYWGFTITLLAVSFFLGRLDWLPIKNYEWLLLALGLSQGDAAMTMTVLGFLLVLGIRSRTHMPRRPIVFNLLQIATVCWAIAVVVIVSKILWDGFLRLPQMKLSGNNSSIYLLNWFVDRIDAEIPSAWFFNVSIVWFRALTLLWALWLARFSLRLLPFAWQVFAREGLLRKIAWRKSKGVDSPETK